MTFESATVAKPLVYIRALPESATLKVVVSTELKLALESVSSEEAEFTFFSASATLLFAAEEELTLLEAETLDASLVALLSLDASLEAELLLDAAMLCDELAEESTVDFWSLAALVVVRSSAFPFTVSSSSLLADDAELLSALDVLRVTSEVLVGLFAALLPSSLFSTTTESGFTTVAALALSGWLTAKKLIPISTEAVPIVSFLIEKRSCFRSILRRRS